MKEAILPEFLIGVLFNKKATIAFNTSQFHKAFYRMKKRSEFTDLFLNIPFTGSPINPFSGALDEALFNMQYAGALSRRNPELIIYSTTGSFTDVYNDLTKGIDSQTLERARLLCDGVLENLTENAIA